jgi:hypothetical protein
VRMAIPHLSQPVEREMRTPQGIFQSEAELLRINFLFPRVAEEDLASLLAMRRRQWQLWHLEVYDQKVRSVRSAADVEYIENEIAKLATEWNQRGVTRLTAVQQEILREKFLKIATLSGEDWGT